MATYISRFGLGDRVCIDGDDTIVVVVTQVCWGDYATNVRVSWFANSYLQQEWVSERRLTAVPEHLVKPRVPEEPRP